MIDSESEAISALREKSKLLGMSLHDALRQKEQELKVRYFLRCVPNRELGFPSFAEFMKATFDSEADPDLHSLISRHHRRVQLPEGERVHLEREQNFRCNVCGIDLRDANVHIDHKWPVCLGGTNDIENLQLICQACNLGKGKLLGWIMGAPFFLEDTDRISAKLRYCVLVHHGSKCQIIGCVCTSHDSLMQVSLKVPYNKSGRYIFDNMTVYCYDHLKKTQEKLLSDARASLQEASMKNKAPILSFGNRFAKVSPS